MGWAVLAVLLMVLAMMHWVASSLVWEGWTTGSMASCCMRQGLSLTRQSVLPMPSWTALSSRSLSVPAEQGGDDLDIDLDLEPEIPPEDGPADKLSKRVEAARAKGRQMLEALAKKGAQQSS